MSVSLAAASLADPGDGTAGVFGTDPWWLVIVKVVAIFGFLVVMTLLSIWWERKLVGWMQQRIGPDRVGPWGLLQSLADGVKLGLKEAIIPKAADLAVYLIAPVVAVIPAFLAFAVIPFGDVVSIGGHQTSLQLTDLPVGVLLILATASIGIYGVVLAGWSSGSTYPLLGALRSSAQMISYEVAMGLSFAAVFLASGTMSTSGVISSQQHLWYAIELAPSFIIYCIAMVGETNRAPFDLPEAEGELVGGFHTEYSSMKFAMFFLAEYVNMVTVSALATTLFLGGWRAPWPLSLIDHGVLNTGWYPLLWFVGKVLLFMCAFIWVRGTLPRLRYDQFMRFGWKTLIPLSLVWLLVVAFIRVADLPTVDGGLGWSGGNHLWIFAVVLAVVLLALLFTGGERAPEPGAGPDGGEPAVTPATRPFDPMAGGFPVPPLPGQQLPPVPPRSARTLRQPSAEEALQPVGAQTVRLPDSVAAGPGAPPPDSAATRAGKEADDA